MSDIIRKLADTRNLSDEELRSLLLTDRYDTELFAEADRYLLRHGNTPFRDFENGSLPLTVRLLGVIRLMFPYVLLPATTALGTIHPQGREMGLKAGANVVMPNLSPVSVRKLYELYENKICTGDESAHCRECLEGRVHRAGYQIVTAIGDVKRQD